MGLAILGDIMLGRHQAPLIEKHGLDKILHPLISVIGERKIIANLESPLLNTQYSDENNKISKLSAKEKYAKILSDIGFSAVSLGNNHIFDFGLDGLINTQSLLEKNSIKYFGAGKNRKEAISASIINLGQKTIGLIGFSFCNRAEESKAGVAYLYDNSVEDSIKDLKDKADFIISMPHAGIELYEYPLKRDQKIYKRMIELGVDLVVGSQSHCVQAREKYLGKYIYYSLGDLLFDHYHEETWNDFTSDISHVKKYSLKPNRHLPQYSLILIIDIINNDLVVHHKPIINAKGFNPKFLNGANLVKWDKKFESINDKLQNDPFIDEERTKIEKKLIKDLLKRKVLING